jgi:hypothetical protein
VPAALPAPYLPHPAALPAHAYNPYAHHRTRHDVSASAGLTIPKQLR